MACFYRNLGRREGTAFALQHAMQEVRASRPHPYYWAPFVLVGKI
jgi:CHAT domain-containing protein